MLDFDLVWLPTMIVSFLVFMVVLNSILIKPLLQVTDERDAGIRGALDEARSAEEQHVATLRKIEDELGAARREAKALIEAERQAGLAEQQKLLQEANRQAEEISKKAKKDLEDAMNAARARLKADAEALSSEIASKLVGRS